MSNNNESQSNGFDDIIYLEGLFFLKEKTIKENTSLVQHAFEDMMKHICYN